MTVGWFEGDIRANEEVCSREAKTLQTYYVSSKKNALQFGGPR